MCRLQREQQQKTGTRDRSSSTIRTVNICSNVSVSGSSSVPENINNTNIGTGCEMIESVSTTKSYSMPSKDNEIYQISSITETRDITENEILLPTSPKNETISTVISSAVGNESELVEKTIAIVEKKSNNKECLDNDDVDMRISEEGEIDNLDMSITKKITDAG